MASIHDHSGKTLYDVTFRMMGTDGKYRWIRSGCKPDPANPLFLKEELVIVKRIVDHIGGSIEVSGRQGEGTTVVVPSPFEGAPSGARF